MKKLVLILIVGLVSCNKDNTLSLIRSEIKIEYKIETFEIVSYKIKDEVSTADAVKIDVRNLERFIAKLKAESEIHIKNDRLMMSKQSNDKVKEILNRIEKLKQSIIDTPTTLTYGVKILVDGEERKVYIVIRV
jgi:hypothetical protein